MKQSTKMEMEAAVENLDFAPVEVESGVLAQKFVITDDKINELADQYLPLKISGVADKYGYGVVHAARIEMRDYRLAVEKVRKDLNADAQTWIKKVNGEAKRLTGLMTPIEEHLDREESAYNAEQGRIKAEKQKEADERLQKRISALQAVDAPFQVSELVTMTETQFDFLLATATETWKVKEAARLDMEAKAKAFEEQQAAAKAEADRIERERLEKVRQEQAAESARLAKQAADLKAQQDKIDAERRAIEQAQREAQIRKDAEEKAKAEAERKAAEAQAKAEAEAKRMKLIEAAKPDAEKLNTLAATIEALPMPDMATEAGRVVAMEVKSAAVKYAAYIRTKAQGLTA